MAAEEKAKYVDLTLNEINELKNKIEKEIYKSISEVYIGAGADPYKLKPFCHLFNIKLNTEDPIETVRALFKKIKQRMSHVINLDDSENTKLLAKIDQSVKE